LVSIFKKPESIKTERRIWNLQHSC